MGLMSIAAIINEIDAYILRLRNARDLLLAPITETRRKSESRRKSVVGANTTGRPLSTRPRILGNKSRLDRTATPVTTSKNRVDSPSQLRSPVVPQATSAREPRFAVPPQKPKRDLHMERLPAPDRRISSTRIRLRPASKRALGTPLEYSKPAIALAGPVHSKIVVVSAEQARRERERAAQPAVQRPRVPGLGRTGKAAFEALFNDGSDTSKTPSD